MLFFVGGLVLFLVVVVSLVVPLLYRVVVPTNAVHIVQSKKLTLSYGKDLPNGNTYYSWPSWFPKYGVVTSKFPLSIFDVDLADYAAYDSGRVPFIVDVKAFFRIVDSGTAAERVSDFDSLVQQLESILQSSIRSILAGHGIEDIMQGRSQFGDQFTKEVDGQLKEWGVQTVKSIEFMDIRDSANSQVIANIMEKKKSLIEKQSRIEVAGNHRDAEIAEINAKRDSELEKQASAQQVGQRTAEKEQTIGIAQEKSVQAVQEEARVTAEKRMAVKLVEQVKEAEIQKDVAVLQTEAKKQSSVIEAEGKLQTVTLEAEARLKSTTLEAEGLVIAGKASADSEKLLLIAQAEGKKIGLLAEAEGEKAKQMAPIEAQLTLAREIGENANYQAYLINLEQIKSGVTVGVEQAKALVAAGIKIIVNTGDVNSGIKTVADLFSPKGGTALGGAIEAFSNTDGGRGVLSSLGIKTDVEKEVVDSSKGSTKSKETPKE